jgi:hypothetical protein
MTSRFRVRHNKSRTKVETKKVPETEKKAGVQGNFYVVEYDRDYQRNEVKKIYGLLVDKRFFRFPEHSRSGGDPASARIVPAARVFRSAKAAAGSLKLIDGYARNNYGRGDIVKVKYTKNADGSFTPRDADGARTRNYGSVYTTKAKLLKASLRELNESIKNKTKEARDDKQHIDKQIKSMKVARAKLLKQAKSV